MGFADDNKNDSITEYYLQQYFLKLNCEGDTTDQLMRINNCFTNKLVRINSSNVLIFFSNYAKLLIEV